MLKKIAAAAVAGCLMYSTLAVPFYVSSQDSIEFLEMISDENDYGEQIYAYESNFGIYQSDEDGDANSSGSIAEGDITDDNESDIANLDESVITVMIDPGHAGYYNRSPVYTSYYESVMNWKLSNYLKTELEALGVHADLTKESLTDDPDLIPRGNKSRGYDFFISMHSNAGSYSSLDQPIAICYQDLEWTDIDDTSREIGRLMADKVAEVMNTNNPGEIYQRLSVEDRDGNGVWDDEWYGVLCGARYVGTPGILLEHSFHTNYRATLWLSNDSNLQTMAKEEAALIYKYFSEKKAEELAEREVAAVRVDPVPKEDWIVGDVSGDGEVSINDAMLVLEYYAVNASGADAKFIQTADNPEGEQLIKHAADVVNDSVIGIDDASAILQLYASNIVSSDKSSVEELLNSMTLEEKIYQLFIVTPEALTGSASAVTEADTTTKTSLEATPVGGLIYYAQNIENWQQTHKMMKITQQYSQSTNNIGMFMAVDEEGGSVARVSDKLGTYDCNDMYYYGENEDYEAVYDIGNTIGTSLSDLGFNLNLAPVADVNISPENELGNRIFSSDPSVVADMTAEFVSGVEDTGVSATLKHFPGLGAGTGDTHHGSVVINRTYEELKETEFVAFEGGIQAGADFVMVGHQITSASQDNLPGCLSQTVVTEWLKKELGFDGLVITDSQSMGAIVDNYTSGEAAVMAVQAGIDVILMPYDLTAAAEAIESAVNAGEITEDRIDESVRKILTQKYNMGLIAA